MISCARCDTSAAAAPGENLPEGWQTHSLTRGQGTYAVCAGCATSAAPGTRSTGNAAADQLRLFIERIETIEEEIKGGQDDRKDVYLEAKACGYDVKVMREIVKRRKMDGHALREFEGILETYQIALKMDVAPEDQHDSVSLHVEPVAEPADSPEPDYEQACKLVFENQKASVSWLQRQLRVGYNSAARLVEKMEREGLVSAPDHVGRRTVLRDQDGQPLSASQQEN